MSARFANTLREIRRTTQSACIVTTYKGFRSTPKHSITLLTPGFSMTDYVAQKTKKIKLLGMDGYLTQKDITAISSLDLFDDDAYILLDCVIAGSRQTALSDLSYRLMFAGYGVHVVCGDPGSRRLNTVIGLSRWHATV